MLGNENERNYNILFDSDAVINEELSIFMYLKKSFNSEFVNSIKDNINTKFISSSNFERFTNKQENEFGKNPIKECFNDEINNDDNVFKFIKNKIMNQENFSPYYSTMLRLIYMYRYTKIINPTILYHNDKEVELIKKDLKDYADGTNFIVPSELDMYKYGRIVIGNIDDINTTYDGAEYMDFAVLNYGKNLMVKNNDEIDIPDTYIINSIAHHNSIKIISNYLIRGRI